MYSVFFLIHNSDLINKIKVLLQLNKIFVRNIIFISKLGIFLVYFDCDVAYTNHAFMFCSAISNKFIMCNP